jgi:hypothetical protein
LELQESPVVLVQGQDHDAVYGVAAPLYPGSFHLQPFLLAVFDGMNVSYWNTKNNRKAA